MKLINKSIPSIRLSEFISEIEDCLAATFYGDTFWITTEICDVNKKPDKRWCYLKLIEKEGKNVTAEIGAVFWTLGYAYIEKFEKETKQLFKDGLEITCRVKVTFHKRWGLKLEVVEIDYAYTLGKLEAERQETLERLVKENPDHIKLVGEQYYTFNKLLPLPSVIQRIALITAPESDGQRDFRQELANNPYGYAFHVDEFLTQIQGDKAHEFIIGKLLLVEAQKERYDVVAVVRGGGSQLDLKAFDNYDLAQRIASFPIPVLTGIGHDRNTSIADLMARQEKTPTKVANVIIQRNFNFEQQVLQLKERLTDTVDALFTNAKNNLKEIKRFVKASNPLTILKKGFAIVKHDNVIVTDPARIDVAAEIQIQFDKETIYSTVTKKKKNGK
ncbi:MAG: exodeoxyribonuclease VII large subunit [Cytophaga sp.]|uniref:exodeoxyribonuclease VII large subunit n=1 Tax=Cytophaga sp. TaxID=29535 RepID=UPI003F7F2C73